MTASSSTPLRPQLYVCVYLSSKALAQTVQQFLSGVVESPPHEELNAIALPQSDEAFFEVIERQKQQLDCLILEDTAKLPQLVNWLHKQSTLLPVVILEAPAGGRTLAQEKPEPVFIYHSAEVRMPRDRAEQIVEFIDRAITAFLDLAPACHLPGTSPVDLTIDLSTQNFLLLQQRRLSEKLKERLGYLGVYYKRNPKNFLRHLLLEEQQAFLNQFRLDYRDIILNYFSDGDALNQKIDDFVNTAFFTDIPVSRIVEIHMELMDEFSKQLKLEGRSEEILLDYRLTLIDTIAHLCEMYRRSIPRES